MGTSSLGDEDDLLHQIPTPQGKGAQPPFYVLEVAACTALSPSSV